METASIAIIAILVAAYAIIILASAWAVARHGKGDERTAPPHCPLSVVVCMHNQEPKEAEACIESIAAVMRDGDEAIVVADHVSERLWDSLTEITSRHTSVRLLRNSGERGKKTAQRMGVEACANATIVSIDGDCQMGKGALDAVRHSVATGEAAMTLLPVAMRSDGTWLGDMMEMEFQCLQVVTAGTALMGHPTMANGAGMAFSHELFLGHDPKSRYASGDDMFLLQHAIATGKRVEFALTSEALVETAAPSVIGSYMRQRVRWLSKAGGYSTLGVKALAMVVAGGVAAWPLALALAAIGAAPLWLTAASFGVKLVCDMTCFSAGRKTWKSPVSLAAAVPLEILYPFMTIAVAAGALFKDKSRW